MVINLSKIDDITNYCDIKHGPWVQSSRLFDRPEDCLVDMDKLRLVVKKMGRMFYFWNL